MMTNEMGLIHPTTESRQSRTGLVSTSAGTRARIQEIAGDRFIPRKKKRELIERELDHIFRIDESQMQAFEAMMKAQIEKEQEQFILALRNDFIDLMTNIWTKVKIAELQCVRDFSIQITRFRQDLGSDAIEQEFKDSILEDARNAFFSLRERLIKVGGERLAMMDASHPE